VRELEEEIVRLQKILADNLDNQTTWVVYPPWRHLKIQFSSVAESQLLWQRPAAAYVVAHVPHLKLQYIVPVNDMMINTYVPLAKCGHLYEFLVTCNKFRASEHREHSSELQAIISARTTELDHLQSKLSETAMLLSNRDKEVSHDVIPEPPVSVMTRFVKFIFKFVSSF